MMMMMVKDKALRMMVVINTLVAIPNRYWNKHEDDDQDDGWKEFGPGAAGMNIQRSSYRD